jgi:serine/threonine-protein kinase
MHQILNEMPADPTTKNPALSPEFNLLLQRAMAKRPEDRFPSAQAFVEALQATHQACSGGSGVSRDSEDDSERTVLVFSSPVSGNEVPEHTEIGGSQGSSTFSTSTAWKAEILPELQTLLSLQVGPMARLLLKSAASNSASLDELCERLLPHIPSEKGRSQFLDGIGSIRKRMASSIDSISSITSTSGHSTSGMTLKTSMAEVAGTRIGLSPEIIEMAGKKLLPYMGPIAPVIVKKTVGRCADRHELFRLLAANLPTADERNRFLRDVGEV